MGPPIHGAHITLSRTLPGFLVMMHTPPRSQTMTQRVDGPIILPGIYSWIDIEKMDPRSSPGKLSAAT